MRKNVILLVFDTLRADYISINDNSGVNTKNIDSIDSQGTTFSNAYTVGPGTPISHGGVFTGRYPSHSGVTGQYLNLPKDHPTMPEWFSKHGYETMGIAGPSKIASDFGYDRGFNEYFEPYYDIGYRNRKPTKAYFKNVLSDWHIFNDGIRTAFRGEIKNTRFKFDYLKDWISSTSEPFFAFANILEAHAPYHPPRGYRSEFDPAFSEPPLFLLEFLFNQLGDHENPNVRLDRVDHVQTGDGIGRYLADSSYLNEDELEALKRWYRASIKYLDDEFGRFLDYYQSNLADDTLLVVTADHGEQLGEHGLMAHSHYLFDETLQVPLLMTGPGVNEAPEGLASLVDLFPTLSSLADIEVPDFTDGVPLFDKDSRNAVFMEHGKRRVREFRESAHGRYMDDEQLRQFAAGRKAVRTETHKLVVDSLGNSTLYNVSGDIETEVSEATIESELRDKLFEVLPEEYGVWPEGDPENYSLDDEVIGSLEDLGYV
ncbi:sulfatase [Natronosalvus caseinilyticus]|uniref:sulfatase n=1 Tax=Natronosalvus caseinilyticus TaxID=2953747 RepID=UPI0028AAE8A5|nr:sulfatase-like hydrolase/transferase [Natronosalvus caseinilyticus]